MVGTWTQAMAVLGMSKTPSEESDRQSVLWLTAFSCRQDMRLHINRHNGGMKRKIGFFDIINFRLTFIV